MNTKPAARPHTIANTTTPTIHILGSGAIASLWACFLSSRGYRCVMIKRRTDAITSTQDTHISYEDNFKDSPNTRSYPVALSTAKALNEQHSEIQRLIIATKSQDVVAALNSVKRLLAKNAEIMTLCNGLGFQEDIKDLLFDRADVHRLAAITSDGALLKKEDKDKHHVCHTGQGHTFLGVWEHQSSTGDSTSNSTNNSTLIDLILNASSESNTEYFPQLKIEFCDNISARSVEKFFINCAINPLTTVHQCKNGELLGKASLNARFSELCAELQAIYNRFRLYSPGFKLPEKDIFRSAIEVAENTARNQSSMFRDRIQGNPLELRYLNEYLIKLANQLQLEAPLSSSILKELRAISDQASQTH